MTPTKQPKQRAERLNSAASPEQASSEDRLFTAYLAVAGVTQEEAEQRRSELLEKAREWQAVENLRRALKESRDETSSAADQQIKAEAGKASTAAARERWRAFLARRKAREQLEG